MTCTQFHQDIPGSGTYYESHLRNHGRLRLNPRSQTLSQEIANYRRIEIFLPNIGGFLIFVLLIKSTELLSEHKESPLWSPEDR